MMQALFIGQTYIDVTLLTDHIPVGDEKNVARDYAVSFGGNAVTAAFCCAKLGIKPDLIATFADDWLGRMFLDMAAKYEIELHTRKVRTSSLSFIMPHDGKRAIVRCRDDNYLAPLSAARSRRLPGAASRRAPAPTRRCIYARHCREAGILTSLDGGAVRSNTHELLAFIDVAIVAERFCEQMHLRPPQTLDYLKSRGCRIGGVTLGERGLLWYDEAGAGAHGLRAAGAGRPDHRHQRRRRRVSRRLHLFLPGRSDADAGPTTSPSPRPPSASRSSTSATRPACRRWPTSPPCSASSASRWREARRPPRVSKYQALDPARLLRFVLPKCGTS